MADIQYWQDSLEEEIEQIRSILDGVQSLSDHVERATALEEADDHMKSATGRKRSLKMEIRLIQDTKLRDKYKKKFGKLDQEIKTLKADLKALQQDLHKSELFVSKGAGDRDGYGEMDGTMAGTHMLNDAKVLQDKTQDSLNKTKQLIAQSEEVGNATLAELEEQKRTLMQIDAKVDEMANNLERAEKLVKQFARKMASDRLIQCFAVVNCLLLLGVVVYAIMKRKGDELFGIEPTPTNPFGNRMLRGHH
eukprot:jgi/Psemu1/283949/fgenesh1_pg.38_\